MKHEHSEALLGGILYQLIIDPVRSTALLASLNSNSLDIDEALYLQEEAVPVVQNDPIFDVEDHDEISETFDDQFEDDLSEFKWEVAKQQSVEATAEEEDKYRGNKCG